VHRTHTCPGARLQHAGCTSGSICRGATVAAAAAHGVSTWCQHTCRCMSFWTSKQRCGAHYDVGTAAAARVHQARLIKLPTRKGRDMQERCSHDAGKIPKQRHGRYLLAWVCVAITAAHWAVKLVSCTFQGARAHQACKALIHMSSCARQKHTGAQHSTAQHSAAQHSTAQHSTAQHSTAQHSTAQHSTAQHSTAQQGEEDGLWSQHTCV
jgi:hypothetical protein